MPVKEGLKSYHFSLGNSTKGPIGYCARIRATSKKEAVEILKAVLPEELKIHPCGTEEQNKAVEYIEAYLNAGPISPKSIDEEEDVDDE
jgi:hypothetical protein